MGLLVSEEQLNGVCSYRNLVRKKGRKRSLAASATNRCYFVKPTVLVDTTEKYRKSFRKKFLGRRSPPSLSPILPSHRQSQQFHLRLGRGRGRGTSRKPTRLLRSSCRYRVDQLLQRICTALPFGGHKQSGWGREMGHEVLEDYTEVKSVCAAPSSAPLVKLAHRSALQRRNQGWSVRSRRLMLGPLFS